jgi:hypothetical protein
MTDANSKPGRRYSREQVQEDLSEGQLKTRCAELGWPCDRLGRDLGEDLNIRIYDDGASSGLNFHVQLKSTANSAALRRKRSAALAYKLEVKDLLHWEVSATLVVLVVWDVEKKTGWWRAIPEIIKDLDETTTGWRKQKTVSVSVPLANGTDAEGMKGLRWAVADYCLPIVPKQDMNFSMTFASMEEGTAAWQTFERALDAGESVTFGQGFVPTIDFPAWQSRIYGASDRGEPLKIEIKPAPITTAKAVRIEVESPEGPASFPRVELRPTVNGRNRLVLTNEHQKLPIIFTFDLSAEHPTFSFRRVSIGNSVYEAREVAAFLLASATPGSTIRVIGLEDGKQITAFESSRASTNHDLMEMRRWRDMLDKLGFIQQRVAGCGAVSMAALGQITTEDFDATECLFQILREGKTEIVKSLSFEITPSDERLPDAHGAVRFDLKGSRLKLFGLNIPLGDVRATVVDSDRFMAVLHATKAQTNSTKKAVAVRLEDMHIIEEYLDWLPGRLPWVAMYEALDHLAEAAGPRDGYFTRADARAAGAGDAVFEALLAEHKIEQVAPDVFHLNHFARSDNEQLLALWLQTDRLGTLSHDTALFLHELSDILPRRRHITVPPGWDPGDRKLDAKVVLHHGEVGEDEIRWLGPVPYTAPLRTVRDCIASHLSPDLIEQAIADGLQRGMFTEADVRILDLLHRGAA